MEPKEEVIAEINGPEHLKVNEQIIQAIFHHQRPSERLFGLFIRLADIHFVNVDYKLEVNFYNKSFMGKEGCVTIYTVKPTARLDVRP